MNPHIRKIFLVTLLMPTLLLTPSAQAYTAVDVANAKGDPTILLAIIEDRKTTEEIRSQALKALPANTAIPLLPKIWNTEDYNVHEYFTLAFFLPSLPIEQRQRLVIIDTLAVSPASTFGAQKAIVDSLAKEGKLDLALTEAKRLYGLLSVSSPESPSDPTAAVTTIAGLLKAKTYKESKSLKEALGAQNSYLEAASKGTLAEHPFSKLPYPSTPPSVEIFTNNLDPVLRCMALLYKGDFDAASQLAEEAIIGATNEELPKWIDFKARAINGKACDPTAANTFLKDIE